MISSPTGQAKVLSSSLCGDQACICFSDCLLMHHESEQPAQSCLYS